MAFITLWVIKYYLVKEIATLTLSPPSLVLRNNIPNKQSNSHISYVSPHLCLPWVITANPRSKRRLHHVVELLVLVELALLLGGGVLVLLVLGDQVVHVGLSLGELHLVHALAGVPVKERLAAEHGGELLGDALHDLLHAGRVAAEADRHLEALGRDVADCALHVVRDPLDEVRGVLVVDVEHLL